jgi:heme exporter protein B
VNEPSLRAACFALARRDLLLAYRHRSELLNPLLFFVIVVSLFPLGVSPESSVLKIMAPGVIWIAALLAILLSLDSLFRADFEDGTLEQMLVSPHPLFVLVLVKVFTHWLVVGLPMVLFAPLLGLLMYLPDDSMPVLIQSLLLGMPILSLIGSIGTALTVGLRRGGVLLSLLVLPLYVPVLIFGATAVDAAGAGLDVSGHISLLAALLALALTLAPFATSAALRVSSS